MSTPPKEAAERTLLGPSASWEETKESLKKQEAKARELDNQIKEKEHSRLQLLEKNAADVPDLVDAGKKEQEEFVNTDDTETNDDGFARADGLMMDPLDILNQCEVVLDKEELEKVRALQKNKKMDRRRRGKP